MAPTRTGALPRRSYIGTVRGIRGKTGGTF
jgi:hypothetical protein